MCHTECCFLLCLSTCVVVQSHVDDEYAATGGREPRVCITTSRDPSSRLRQFAVEMKLVFPNSARMNRGNTTIKEMVDVSKSSEFSDIIVLQETRGEPDAMLVSHLPFGPTVHFSLTGTVLRHDIENRGTVSEAFPHLIFSNFATPLGARVKTVLQHLFPVPKPDSKRVMTLSNDADYSSFRHHTFERAAGAKPTAKSVTLQEVGPRFELHPYKITLGTVDQTDADTEWTLRPFMNTARKRQAL